MRKATLLCSWLILPASAVLFIQACGHDDGNEPIASQAIVSSDQTSTLTSHCPKPPMEKLGRVPYCKTLSSGAVSTVDLGATDYEQDPTTCEITSPNDGMKATLIEMGYAPC